MSEKILRALMQLFAIIGKAEDGTAFGRPIVESFLKQQLNSEQVAEHLKLYDAFVKAEESGEVGEKKRKKATVSSVKVIVICEQINEELTQRQKIVVLIRLIEFIWADKAMGEQDLEFVSTVASSFHIPDDEFYQCLNFIKRTDNELEDIPDLLLINNATSLPVNHVKHIYSETLSGEVRVLRMRSVGIYIIRYSGSAELYLNGQAIGKDRIHVLSQGSSIRSSKVQPIYFSDIIARFLSDSTEARINLSVKEVEFRFKNGKTGLHPLSFSESSGKMIGIMGGSGAGKSTLLNILNGNEIPTHGEVLINGFNLHEQKEELEGIIGFVSQDDLLIDELSVYQNLFYNSKLCFDSYTDQQINHLVVELLIDLGLYETRNLKVGNPLEKTISGGQRKRLNIALELIRKPGVLFVDEPTSGLSSRDSENIMDLLKELALKGKLVFVVIHQPSSEIFKMFDKLLILDHGGFPIYYGNPVESIIYFKKVVHHINPEESECIHCGNVNPEQIFNIIESKVVDENGHLTRNRKVAPAEWNAFYLEDMKRHPQGEELLKDKPVSTFRKPNYYRQFKIFIRRDILAKITNTQYLIINLLEAPLLAFILAFMTKYYKQDGVYTFDGNKNLPAYIFMAVVVALFIGLTVSAEEIIRDRKILKRESFLNLSRGSYLFSKIAVMFFISAVQTLLFVLIGNSILEIKDMYSCYWLVLFSSACFANMLGLNISASFNSAVTIYILIPFLLIPQLLLSGVIVKFEELNPKISSLSVVPVSGEVMTSRWAFEALAVHQFGTNKFEKPLYELDKLKSEAQFKKNTWFETMNDLLSDALDKPEKAETNLKIIKHEIREELIHTPGPSSDLVNRLSSSSIDKTTAAEVVAYLNEVKKHYVNQYGQAEAERDAYISKFQETEAGREQWMELKKKYHNDKLFHMVMNLGPGTEAFFVEGDQIVQTSDPVFRDGSADHFIRAHFYAPTKNVFGKKFDTYWVNVAVIWIMTLGLALALYFNLLRKVLDWFGGMTAMMRRQKAGTVV